MNRKELGTTGVPIPEIGLGTCHYHGGISPLRKGIELGARLIDTAEAYGTEAVVGEAIQGIREKVFLATKVSLTHFRRGDLLKAADESLRRLRTNIIDLYQLHRPHYVVPIEETMAVMEELVERGKVRFIGVSNFSVNQLRKAQAALSKNKIVSNQVQYNLIDRTIATGLLPYCQQNHITIIAYSPLAKGLPRIAKQDTNDILGKVAAATGKTRAQVALNWCISRDAVIAIPKADSKEHVTENCRASGWRLSPEQSRLLDEGIRFRQRGRVELALRRMSHYALQRFGLIDG